jgi:hypothetical protein
VTVEVEGLAPLTLASLDFVNTNAVDDGACFAYQNDVFFEDGTTEVSTSGSYNSVRFVNNDGLMVWEVLPHGAHLTFNQSLPMWISEWSPICTLSEVVQGVSQQIALVAAAEGESVQIGGIISYLTSGEFGRIWYGGPYWGGLVNPATDQRCHASDTLGGRINKVGKMISSPDNWIRVQIWNENIGTPEFDYPVAPGTITITEPGTSIRYWIMENCNSDSANRDAAASPDRRRAVAKANTGGYVENWQSHFSSDWFDYEPAS